MNAPRGCGASAVIAGQLYVYSGDCNTTASSAFQRYNPASNSWTVLPVPSFARRLAAGAAVGGKFYLVGGFLSTGFASSVLEVFDPGTNTWTLKTAGPTQRYGAAAGAVNGLLYVVGGALQDFTRVRTLEVYDPGSNTWRIKPPMTVERQTPAAAVVNGSLHVIGGLSRIDYSSVNESYRPGDVWIDQEPDAYRKGRARGRGRRREDLRCRWLRRHPPRRQPGVHTRHRSVDQPRAPSPDPK